MTGVVWCSNIIWHGDYHRKQNIVKSELGISNVLAKTTTVLLGVTLKIKFCWIHIGLPRFTRGWSGTMKYFIPINRNNIFCHTWKYIDLKTRISAPGWYFQLCHAPKQWILDFLHCSCPIEYHFPFYTVYRQTVLKQFRDNTTSKLGKHVDVTYDSQVHKYEFQQRITSPVDGFWILGTLCISQDMVAIFSTGKSLWPWMIFIYNWKKTGAASGWDMEMNSSEASKIYSCQSVLRRKVGHYQILISWCGNLSDMLGMN